MRRASSVVRCSAAAARGLVLLFGPRLVSEHVPPPRAPTAAAEDCAAPMFEPLLVVVSQEDTRIRSTVPGSGGLRTLALWTLAGWILDGVK